MLVQGKWRKCRAWVQIVHLEQQRCSKSTDGRFPNNTRLTGSMSSQPESATPGLYETLAVQRYPTRF